MIQANFNMNSIYLEFFSVFKFINPCLSGNSCFLYSSSSKLLDTMEVAICPTYHFIYFPKMQRKIIHTFTISSLILTVQPDPPANVTLELKKPINRKPYLMLTWSPPPLADVRSGWLTLDYELRLKPEEGEEWEVRILQVFP